ncbi:ethanolamine utilization protein EutJ [Iodobacter sp. HSC-16F04]|uniref:Ethanolamine utilization protein EutJ n=1 Tax=Iodobacter violaceini TaxID=3044271 RepID=A0ABX0KR11_9NEIS|nr:ethanolamine utilization protein EutJ [Iodobacter violacea]NHQ86109.1 ethanolamine utilization protein EutJ [Iodobacter violacea]
MTPRDIQSWLQPRLDLAHALLNDATPAGAEPVMALGIDLGTSDVVSMVVDQNAQPLAVCLDWADVVRDGIVWDFFGAVTILRRHLDTLESIFGQRFSHAATSFPPGTDPRISVNVLEAAGLNVTGVCDEPSAVAHLLQLDRAAVVDIGGGTTGIAVVEGGRVIYSGDEPTGGHHISLTLAGSLRMALEDVDVIKKTQGKDIWPVVKPVFEKMSDIVRDHLVGHEVADLYLSGGSCTMPGVQALFAHEFPNHRVHLPRHPIYLTPLAIAAYALSIVAEDGNAHV